MPARLTISGQSPSIGAWLRGSEATRSSEQSSHKLGAPPVRWSEPELLPERAVVDDAKFTHYLLTPRPWDDKSGYLRQVGFDLKTGPTSSPL